MALPIAYSVIVVVQRALVIELGLLIGPVYPVVSVDGSEIGKRVYGLWAKVVNGKGAIDSPKQVREQMLFMICPGGHQITETLISGSAYCLPILGPHGSIVKLCAIESLSQAMAGRDHQICLDQCRNLVGRKD